MERFGWKILAIIFIIYSIFITGMMVWGYFISQNEVKNTNICYYKVCADYPEATYQDKICSCFGYDVLGKLKIIKQEYMD